MTNPLVEREWLTGDELTATGSHALADLKTKVQVQRRRITAGISDEEYLATVDVLRRMARNLAQEAPSVTAQARRSHSEPATSGGGSR